MEGWSKQESSFVKWLRGERSSDDENDNNYDDKSNNDPIHVCTVIPI